MARYLSTRDVLLAHYQVIETFGGSHGVRDMHLLESALDRPKASFNGHDLYPTIEDKSAALVHSLVKNHPFTDGNKRTAAFCLETFLFRNGFNFTASSRELVDFMINIAANKDDEKTIKEWIRKHSKRK